MKTARYAAISICCIAVLAVFAARCHAELPTVVIVTTGGTIAEKTDTKTGGAVPAVSGKDLIAAVPGLGKVANIEVVNLCNIDSSQMTPEIWAQLSKTVDAHLADPKVKGAVVTHGTDTMAEGAYFLELTLKSNKPVAFVGAMRDASDVSPDGPANILNAVTQVCSKEAQDWGVTITLNQYVNSARNVVKTNSTNVQTFDSGEKGYLGYIVMGKVIRYNVAPAKQKLPLPDKLPDVAFLSTFAGDDGSFVRFAADHGSKGIVVDAVGAGNVNEKVYEAVKYAMAKGIPVVITTSVYHSGVWPMYGDQGGGATMEKDGAILGGDLTGAKARLLLMLAIAKEKGDVSKIKGYFKR
ncbi:MAG: asparaginase [Candidatus Omnitrophica bacterium]|nr:asparaginase [Candidatus Omnitrophota bacterium]